MEIRLLSDRDSIEELTGLIHRAYRGLAELGFRYWGTHQTVEDTKTRIAKGECFILERDRALIATILLSHPGHKPAHPWYARPEVATFHQFAVDPVFQRQGLGAALLDFVEARAMGLGAAELACDTAKGAVHLIDMYQNRGYRQVDTADWPGTNYPSVILSKAL